MTRRNFSDIQRREIKRMFLVKGKKKIKDIKAYRRLHALYLRSIGKTNKEITDILGFHPQYITSLVTKYIKSGIDAILTDKRTSNNRRMSYADESKFLGQFLELADAGQILTVSKIHEKFDEVTGKSNNQSTIFRLLKRHGWRKVKPRPRHPGRASDEEISSSKKLRQYTESCWKIITQAGKSG